MSSIDFKGKRFAITGTLPIIRSAAVAQLEHMGGVYKRTVTRDTDYLIIGNLRKVSNKLVWARSLQASDTGLIIISGDVLFSTISC